LPTKGILDEIRNSSNNTLSTSSSLDGAANNMILVVGATIGFLVTLSSAIIFRISPKFPYFESIIILMLIGIIVNIAAVIVFLLVRRIRNYQHVMSGDIFMDRNNLDKLIAYDEENLEKHIILSYVATVYHNQSLNSKKSGTITTGESLFVSGVIILLVSLALQLIAITVGAVSE
jgi:hypothetical protein